MEEKKQLTVEADYKLIAENYEKQPKTIILEYAGKFWLQLLKPLVKDSYESLDETYYYENINDPYIKNPSFNSMEEALVANKLFRTLPIQHRISDTPDENGDFYTCK